MVPVFLLSKKGLLGEGLQCLLREWADIEFVGYTTDPKAAIDQICKLKPAAVIAENGIPHYSPALILASALSAGVSTCVIGVDVDSNELTLYREAQHRIERAEDLHALICEDEVEQADRCDKSSVDERAS